MSTPIYTELFDLYADHRTRFRDYFMRGRRAAYLIQQTLFQALGIPDEHFQTDDGLRPWVQLYDVSYDGKISPVSWTSLSNWDDEGRLKFAVGAALSHKLNSYPKSYFWISYQLRIDGEKLLVTEVAGDQRTFDIASDDGLSQLVAAFCETLRGYLGQRPEDSFKPRPGIGFY